MSMLVVSESHELIPFDIVEASSQDDEHPASNLAVLVLGQKNR